jgi:hypothetical protein
VIATIAFVGVTRDVYKSHFCRDFRRVTPTSESAMWFTSSSVTSFLLFFSTLGLSIGAGNDTEATRSQGVATCTTLQSALGTDIVMLSGPQYTAGASGAWNVFNTKSSPACIVFPKDTTHVQTAMTAIYQNKVRYAVQAGGHSAMKGWNTYVWCIS